MIKKWDISLTKFVFYIVAGMSFGFLFVIEAFNLFYDYSVLSDRLVMVEQQKYKNEERVLKAGIDDAYATIIERYKLSAAKTLYEMGDRLLKVRQQLIIGAKGDDLASLRDFAIQMVDNMPDSGLFSVYDLNGKPLLHPLRTTAALDLNINPSPSKDSVENLNKPNLSNPTTSVPAAIASASSDEVSFIDSPGVDGSAIRTALIRIPQLGIVLGYSQDDSRFRQQFLSSLRDFAKDEARNQSRYIFMLSRQTGKYLYSNFIDFDDEKSFSDYPKEAQEVYTKIVDLLSRSGSKDGVLRYSWEKPDGTFGDKLAYVRDIGIMGIVIGKGSYVDAIDASVANEKRLIKEQFAVRISVSLGCFLLLILTAVLAGYVLKNRLDKAFNLIRGHFENLSVSNEPILSSQLDFREFKDLAERINLIVAERLHEQEVKQHNMYLLEQYRQAIDESAIVTKTNVDGIITFANEEFCAISGYSKDELLGRSHNIIRHPDVEDEFFANMWQTITSRRVWEGTVKSLNKSGSAFYVRAIIIPILDRHGRIQEYIAIRHDITDIIEQERRIQSHLQDPLTGLPNRQALIDEINHSDESLTMASFDISRFKEINEYYGFDMGDAVIVEVGRMLQAHLGATEIKLYKLTSDQFAMLGTRSAYPPQRLYEVCLDLIEHFKQHHIYVGGNKFEVSLVFGISSTPSYFITSEMARDYAKLSRLPVVIFDDKMDLLVGNVNLTHSLKRAIADDRIVVYRQAIVDNKTKKPIKYECLMRMIDDNGSVVSPFHFINLAKRSNQYHKLTEIVIEKAFEFFSQNNDEFSINLAIDDIVSGRIREFLRQKLKEYDGIGNRLTLEIVEDEGIQNFKEVTEFIDEMHSFGCAVAVDDFGTGYSNFEYLIKLKADFIKIDGSMIQHIDTSEESRRVVELMVAFAKQLNIKVVAEFVRSKSVSIVVEELGIDASQGYFYDEPKPLMLAPPSESL